MCDMSNAKVKLKHYHFTPSMILLILSIYILPAQAFFRHLCFGELGNGRVDPIMSPGKASQHLHISFGASSMSIAQTPGDNGIQSLIVLQISVSMLQSPT